MHHLPASNLPDDDMTLQQHMKPSKSWYTFESEAVASIVAKRVQLSAVRNTLKLHSGREPCSPDIKPDTARVAETPKRCTLSPVAT